MLDFVIETFAELGLLARPARQDRPEEIRIGEGEWSCLVSIAYFSLEDETEIFADCVWIEIMNGPMKGNCFRLSELAHYGLIGLWQLFGGRFLRNKLLADMRCYNHNFSQEIGQVTLQDMEEAVSDTLAGFGYGNNWRIPADFVGTNDDTVVFDDEPTQPWITIFAEKEPSELALQN